MVLRRTAASTHSDDEPNDEESGEGSGNPPARGTIPLEDTSEPIAADPVDVVVLDRDEEDSEDEQSGGDSVQIVDPTPDEAGYNADAEDDKGDADDGVEGHVIIEDTSAPGPGDDSGDEAFAVAPVDPIENDDSEVVDDSGDEGLSDAESREETDEPDAISNASAILNVDERMSEDDNSDDEQGNAEAALDATNILHNEREGTEEDEESAEEVDEREPGTGAAEDPREEDELSDEPEDGSENGVVEVGTDGNSDRGDEEERSSGSEVFEDLLDHGDAASPVGAGDHIDMTAAEEKASEGEENYGDDDEIVEAVEAVDNRESEYEHESAVDDEGEASDVELAVEGDDHSEAGEHGEEGMSEGESEDYGNTDDAPARGNETPSDAEKAEEQASESEGDDEDIAEEKEEGDAEVADSSVDGEEERAENAREDAAPESADGSSKSCDVDDAEKADEEVSDDEIEDGIDDEDVARDDADDEGSEDDLNDREVELVPRTPSVATTDSRDAGEKASRGEHRRDSGKSSRLARRLEAGLRKAESKGGVIYLARVPPGLDVTGVRSLLSRVTEAKRVWLRAETKAERRRRQSLGGSRRKERFRDGWVEVGSGKEARRVVGLLNGRPMTAGKRRGRWAQDLWCLKYLKGFRWADLTKEVFGGRERVLRVRESVQQGRRERAWIEGRGRGGGERVRRFRQKRVREDPDDVRAAQAAERVDRGSGWDAGGQVDAGLAGLLFKRRKT